MASHIKGNDYKLYYRSGGNYASPTWSEITAVDDLGYDPGPSDVTIPVRGGNTGHLHGANDPSVSFTLYEDSADANVTALVSAVHDGTSVHLAVANGLINTNGTKYFHGECALFATHAGNRTEGSMFSVEARRHGDSDNDFAFATVGS